MHSQPLKANARAEFFLQRWNDFLADAELPGVPNASKSMPSGAFKSREPPKPQTCESRIYVQRAPWVG